MTSHGAAIRVAIDDGGRGAPAYLFVHSLGGRADFWSDVLVSLRKHVRAVAFDLRGHGASPAAPAPAHALDDFVDDALAAVQAAGLGRFVLVGHSFGALVALAVAARAPKRVAGLVLVDAGGAMDAVPPAALEEFLASVGSAEGHAFVRDTYEQNLERASAATRERVLASLAATDPAAILGGYTALFGSDPQALLAGYGGPVRLVVDAANDSPMMLHAQHRDLDVVPVEGVSHWINLDNPEAIVRAIAEVEGHGWHASEA
jgi:pimeloyl-ACP methyl ester carboxylesterase